jgi:hypothetical protein
MVVSKIPSNMQMRTTFISSLRPLVDRLPLLEGLVSLLPPLQSVDLLLVHLGRELLVSLLLLLLLPSLLKLLAKFLVTVSTFSTSPIAQSPHTFFF